MIKTLLNHPLQCQIGTQPIYCDLAPSSRKTYILHGMHHVTMQAVYQLDPLIFVHLIHQVPILMHCYRNKQLWLAVSATYGAHHVGYNFSTYEASTIAFENCIIEWEISYVINYKHI